MSNCSVGLMCIRNECWGDGVGYDLLTGSGAAISFYSGVWYVGVLAILAGRGGRLIRGHC